MTEINPPLQPEPARQEPPPRRSMGLAWSLLAVGVLAYLLWFHEPQQHSEPASPQWINQQREFLDAYSLQDGVIQKQSGLLIKHITQGTEPHPRHKALSRRITSVNSSMGEPSTAVSTRVNQSVSNSVALSPVGAKPSSLFKLEARRKLSYQQPSPMVPAARIRG